MSKITEGRQYLEAMQPGAFEAVCEAALTRGGVLHMAPDCLLAGYPCEDNPRCLHVIFQCSELPALYRLLCALPYTEVEWRRDYGHSEHYGVRRRAIRAWGRKLALAERMNNRKNEDHE